MDATPIHYFPYEAALGKFHKLLESPPDGRRFFPDPTRHKLIGYDEDGTAKIHFRLPLPWPRLPEQREALADYLAELPSEIPSYSMALIQAGAAALGYFEGGEVMLHKSFKKYMKRHRRGKAQISYLKTRGKSKAGSRIRLANSVRFFEEVNERLTEWEEDFQPQRILYSCTAQLWGLLFQSNVPPPFAKKDPRLIKIPKDVRVPSHEELMRINAFVLQGQWEEL